MLDNIRYLLDLLGLAQTRDARQIAKALQPALPCS